VSRLNALLAAELSAAVRTGRFWNVVARNAIPVVGVLALGWSATLVIVFYLVETWLFFSLRWSIEIAIKHDLATTATVSGRQAVIAAAKRFLITAPIIGFLLFMFIWMVVIAVASQWDWKRFWAGDYKVAAFAVGLAGLIIVLLVEEIRFGRRYLARSTDRDDELREGSMIYRIPCLMAAGLPAFFLAPTRYGAHVLVVALALVSIWIEGAPRHATKLFGMPRAHRLRLFRRP
jgi:hypothetical protein